MKIWLIQTGEPLPLDKNIRHMRTSILAGKLHEQGHQVTWWTSCFDHLEKKWLFDSELEVEFKPGFVFQPLKGKGYQSNISLRRLADHRKVASRFATLAMKKEKPDIIVASIPTHDLTYQVAIFARKNNIPLIIDVRDLWPDFLLNAFPEMLKKIFRPLLFHEYHMLRYAVRNATSLVANCSNYLDWALKHAGRDKSSMDAVFYLGYKKASEIADDSRLSESTRKILDATKSTFTVTFIGTLGAYHSPAVIIEAAKKLQDKSVSFIIAGDGELKNALVEKASSLPNVYFTGWISEPEIGCLLTSSHLGVCPTPKKASLFPNKAFAYLSAGLPMLSSFEGELHDIIEKYSVGFNIKPEDSNTFAEKISFLKKYKTIYASMSENAKKLYDSQMNADTIYKNYVEHIETIAQRF